MAYRDVGGSRDSLPRTIRCGRRACLVLGLAMSISVGGFTGTAAGTGVGAGSAIERLERDRADRAASPDVYAAWNASTRALDLRPSIPGGPISRVAAEPLENVVTRKSPATSRTMTFVGIAAGLLLLALIVVSGAATRRDGLHGKRPVLPARIEAAGPSESLLEFEPPALRIDEMGEWPLDHETGMGEERSRAVASRLEEPPPSPEEMNRHLGELLGKVRGAKPLAKHNDEF